MSVDAVLDADIEAVLIASSTNTHADLIERAAATGKAIFCEKPIDLDTARARRACAAVKAAGVPFMIGFNRRFDASHMAVRQAVAEGEVGKVEIVQLTSRGPDVPPIEYVKVSGGQMRDQTIHFFDLLRWLVAGEPAEVYGAALVNPAIDEAGDVDTSLVALHMRSGALCQIDCSRRTAYGYDERVEVFGSAGAFGFDFVGGLGYFDVKVIEVHDLIQGLCGADDCFPDFAFGLANERIIDAMECSAESGSRVALTDAGFLPIML